MDAAALEEWLPRYLDATVRLHHPGLDGPPGGPCPSTGAAVVDLIHGATNNPMAIYEMGPAVARPIRRACGPAGCSARWASGSGS